jgi:hypothetical protein
VTSLADLCALLEQVNRVSETGFRSILVTEAGIPGSTADNLIACLKDAGIVFNPT